MKIEFKSSVNAKQLSSVRSQISSKGDLKKFDDFLARYDSLDTDNAEQMTAAKGCCAGENCCQNISLTVKTGL